MGVWLTVLYLSVSDCQCRAGPGRPLTLYKNSLAGSGYTGPAWARKITRTNVYWLHFLPNIAVTHLTNEATTEYSHFRNFTLKLRQVWRELAVDWLMDCLYTDTTTTTNRKPIILAATPAALITTSTNIKVKVLTVNNHSSQRLPLPVSLTEPEWGDHSCFDYCGPRVLFRQRNVWTVVRLS